MEEEEEEEGGRREDALECRKRYLFACTNLVEGDGTFSQAWEGMQSRRQRAVIRRIRSGRGMERE